jgi:hypothetical protein
MAGQLELQEQRLEADFKVKEAALELQAPPAEAVPWSCASATWGTTDRPEGRARCVPPAPTRRRSAARAAPRVRTTQSRPPAAPR